MERRNKFRGVRDRIGNYDQDSPHKQRNRRADDVIQDSRVGHRAHRALVAGKLGILRVNVGRLHKGDKGHCQNAHQGQGSKGNAWPRFVSVHRQCSDNPTT